MNLIDAAIKEATITLIGNRYRANHNHYGLMNYGYGDTETEALADLRSGLEYQLEHNGTPF